MAKPIGLMIAVGGKHPPPPRYKATPDEPPKSAAPAAPSHPALGKGGDPAPSDLDAGRPEQDVTVSPEAVDYHDSSESCSVCEYMAGDQCRMLKMPVDPQGHCEAFEAKAGDMDQGQGQDLGQGADQMSQGGSYQ